MRWQAFSNPQTHCGREGFTKLRVFVCECCACQNLHFRHSDGTFDSLSAFNSQVIQYAEIFSAVCTLVRSVSNRTRSVFSSYLAATFPVINKHLQKETKQKPLRLRQYCQLISFRKTNAVWTVYRCPGGRCARFRENVPYIKVHRSNPKHLHPKLNGYGDNGERKVWSSCGSTYCNCFTYCYSCTAHVRPSISQPSQTHSDFINNRCHSYSEL